MKNMYLIVLSSIFLLNCQPKEVKTITFTDINDKVDTSTQQIAIPENMDTLLHLLSERAITVGEHGDLSEEQIANKWLGFPPATEEAILAAEKRLNIKLPEEYKAFLRITNGFVGTVVTAPDFLPVERINYLRNEDPDLIYVWSEHAELRDVADALARSILIADVMGEQIFLLIPPNKTQPKWRYWLCAR